MTLWDKRPDMIVHKADPYNAEPPPSGLDGQELTPVASFYSRNHGEIPTLDPDEWRLQVGGLVDSPLELSLDQLRDRYEAKSLVATLQCAGNRRAGLVEVRDIPGEDPWGVGATSTAEWAGVSLADVLASAGARSDAAHVAFEAADVSALAEPTQPYGGSIPAHKARSPEVLLAWGMNGEPLTRVHGAPLRVVVPGYIGARSVKWVQRITARAQPSDNYFQATAYRLLPAEFNPATAGPGDGLSLASIALNAAILRPLDNQQVPQGAIRVSGYALAGDDRAVARLDVSVDAGRSWRQAALAPALHPWSWQQWHIDVDLRPGPAEIVARAWDSTGAAQPESAGPLWNPKGYVNNSWARVRVTVAH